MDSNMTLRVNAETRDLIFDSEGNLETIFGDETTAQNIRNTLTAWKKDWRLDPSHGTDYERILGKKDSELEPDEIEEVLREAIFQETAVAQIDALKQVRSGRGMEISFTAALGNGHIIGTKVVSE